MWTRREPLFFQQRQSCFTGESAGIYFARPPALGVWFRCFVRVCLGFVFVPAFGLGFGAFWPLFRLGGLGALKVATGNCSTLDTQSVTV